MSNQHDPADRLSREVGSDDPALYVKHNHGGLGPSPDCPACGTRVDLRHFTRSEQASAWALVEEQS